MKVDDLPEHIQRRIKKVTFRVVDREHIDELELHPEYPTVVRAAAPGPTPPDPWNRQPWLLNPPHYNPNGLLKSATRVDL